MVFSCDIKKEFGLIKDMFLYYKIKRLFIEKSKNYFFKILNRVASYKKCNNSFIKIGSDYGGWVVPEGIIKDNWISYTLGVGEDVTFDLGLIENYKCNVYAFDPTPRSIEYVKRIQNTLFHFSPYGIWSKNELLKFFVPKNPAHVSHSITNLQDTEGFFEAECITLKEAMKKLSHSHIDLLKLDIEGAHHAVIKSMLSDKIYPKILNVEFDQPDTLARMSLTVFRLLIKGYILVFVDGYNLTFTRYLYK